MAQDSGSMGCILMAQPGQYGSSQADSPTGWQIRRCEEQKPQGGVVSWGRLGLQLSAAGTL